MQKPLCINSPIYVFKIPKKSYRIIVVFSKPRMSLNGEFEAGSFGWLLYGMIS